MDINEWGPIWRQHTLPFIHHLADLDHVPNGKTPVAAIDMPMHWRTFDDDDERRDLHLASNVYGSFRDEHKRLMELNQQGAGIFVTINETNGLSSKKDGITNIRAYWADSESDLDYTALELPPSMVIRSKRGPHVYWLSAWDLDCQQDGKDQCTRIVKNIAHKLGTDTKVKDFTRVMRVPGFFHMKDARDPFMVTLEHFRNVRYSFLDMLANFPDIIKDAPRRPLECPRIVRRDTCGVEARAASYVAAIEGACQGERDHNVYQVACRLMRGFMLTEAQALPILEEYCSRCMPPMDPEICLDKLRNAVLYGEEEMGGKV